MMSKRIIAALVAVAPLSLFAVTHSVKVNADGSFTPAVTYIATGDTVEWTFSTPYDSVIPVNWDGASPGFCSAIKPYSATDPNQLTGPMPLAVSGIFTLSPLGAGYTVETAKSRCSNGLTPRTTAGTEMLCAGGAQGATTDAVWTDPSLTGVFIRLLWNELQIAPGTADSSFDFTILDREMNKAVKNGKVFSLGIKAGDDGTPSWLFTNGVTKLNLRDKGSDDEAGCGFSMALGNPTEAAYQQRYFDMLRKVAAHVRSRADWYRALAYIKPSGANLVSHENRLPKRCDPGCTCNTQILAQNHYTPAGLYAFYQAQLDLLAVEFPNKTMSYALIQDGFPKINDAGDYEKSDGTSSGGPLPAGSEQTQTIIDNGQAAYHLAFAVQHNGLSTKKADNCLRDMNGIGCPNRWVLQEGKEGQVTGFQTTNETKVATPADVDSALQNELLNSQGIFLELYEERFWEAVHQPNGVIAPAGSGFTMSQWSDQLRNRRLNLFPALGNPFPTTYAHTFTLPQGLSSQTLYYVHGAKCGVANPAAIIIQPANAAPPPARRRGVKH